MSLEKEEKNNLYFRKCLEGTSWQFKFYCLDLIVGLQKQFSLLTNKNNGFIRSRVNQNIKFRQEKKITGIYIMYEIIV